MSTWTTVSVETPDSEHYYRTEYNAWGQSQMDQPLPEQVTGPKLSEVIIIACNDTSDAAKIAYSNWTEAKDAIPHKNSLWTVTKPDTFGDPYNPEKDILKELPDWHMVRGNWRRGINN
jgi:hypothetical protein